ncbi:rhomboid family intramembrane serine protease [Rubrobacter indicoceani]|uniref:rhomboid family intramembrane serine protease n=1 Tax=Rubrobacter indicoceani TaxID=2051957 RepID=UPI000E5C555B|nr:rhomboid family intramembrane serine protease [Rubrobacter indicoceani]
MQTQSLPVTFSLIAACVVVYVGIALSSVPATPLNIGLISQPSGALSAGALVPALVSGGEVWRIASSMFLHSGLVHILMNMVSLFFLGSFVEPLFGRARFLALYLLSGLSGGVAYLYFGGFDTPAVGASGAIFGLLGGIFGYALRERSFSWSNPVIRQLLILLAINLYIGFSIPNVSNTAHLGGLAGGALFGLLIAPAVSQSAKRRKSFVPVAAVLLAEVALIALWLIVFAEA